MIKRYAAVAGFIFLSHFNIFSQDLALTAPIGSFSSPITACNLSSTETVTVNLFNFGSNLPMGTSFDVSYTINGGAPVTENVVLASTLLANSTYTYTFTTPANLSVPGTYTFTATVTLAGDINSSNDTYVNYSVTNNAPSAGGIVSGGTNVCISGNSGNLTLSGHTGTVLNWEYSIDGGSTWINISNTTTTQSYLNLTVPTRYRAVVQNANCAPALSSEAIMTIDAVSVGGTTAGSSSGCISGNSGTVTLSGKVGNVLNWQFSTDGGATWTNIANTTTSQTYLNLLTTTIYRAQVQNGACPAVNSNNRTITIAPLTVSGTVSDNDTVCASGNSGTLTLAGQTGNIVRWESSIDGGGSWTNITNTTATQNFSNLTQTTKYRVRVQSSPCPVQYTTPITISVDASTIPGTLSTSSTVCSGSNSGTLNLTGNNGNVLNWESSIDGGTTWTNIANTTTSENYLNLTAPTLYRSQIKNGVCPAQYSDTVSINVDSTSLGGNISSPATVCSGSNTGTLSLSGKRGDILNWEFSTDGGASWNNIINTTANQNYNNLTITTLYRVQVQNGVCAPTFSDTLIIDVDSGTIAGNVTTSTTVCSGNNTGVLNLGGYTGDILEWQFSSDGGFTFLPIANTTSSQTYNNLTASTLFRARVQNGVCPASNSTPATIVVDPVAIGGNIIGSTTVCASGNSGTLSLVAFNNSVTQWEQSTDGGATFTPIANTTNTQNYSGLTQSTIFRAIVSSGTCPTDTSGIATIMVDQPTVGGVVTSSDTVCAGANSDVLMLSGHTGSVLNWELSTDNGSTWLTLANTGVSQSYNNLLTSSLYRVHIKNGVCADSVSSIASIVVNPQSNGGVVGSSASGCEGYNSGLLNLTGQVGDVLNWVYSTDGGATYLPIVPTYTGTSFNYFNLTDTTMIRAVVQSGNCASDTSSAAVITIYPKPNASFVSDTVCAGSDIHFINTSTINNGFITLNTWDFGDGESAVLGSPHHSFADAGNYPVTLVTMSNFGCLDTITINAGVNALPNALITSSNGTIFCSEDSTELLAVFNPNYDYAWSNGDTTISTMVDVTSTVTLTVTDNLTGCVDSSSITITENPSPVAYAGMDTTINLGENIQLFGSGGGTYLWSHGASLNDSTSSSPIATPQTTTIYILTVTSPNGCSDTDSVQVTVNETINLLITNLITPNEDGFNDTWYIENIDLFPNNKVEIFNRQGQVVFKMDGYDNTWGGTFNGEILPDGTYYYVLQFTDTGQALKGSVNILRSK